VVISHKAAFLAAFAATANVTKAAKAAKIERCLHYRWLKDDDGYALDFKAALEQAAQTLEDEAVRRANEGVLEPLVYQGQFSYKQRPAKDAEGKPVLLDGKPVLENYGAPLAIRAYSDGLLQFLLKGARPEKYRERSNVEVSAPGGGPIAVTNEGLAKLTDDELASLIALASKLTEEK
jgi:hypothetical protein